jgi:DNA-binding CsgD family transcriptional regulator
MDITYAREVYIQAMSFAMVAGRFSRGVSIESAARTILDAPPPSGVPRPTDLILDATATYYADGPFSAAPMLRRSVNVFRGPDVSLEEELLSQGLVVAAAFLLWDDEALYLLASRHAHLARQMGALGMLHLSLFVLAHVHVFTGDVPVAASLLAEAEAIGEMTGAQMFPPTAASLAALRGREPDASSLIERLTKEAVTAKMGIFAHWAQAASAMLYNGLAQYEQALAIAREASEQPEDWISALVLPELIEAAVRCGSSGVALEAFDQLVQSTTASGNDWALGIEARSRAQISEGSRAEDLYLESIERLGRTRIRVELARSHLLYGEWLRRERRRIDARVQLRLAHNMFTTMGAEAFAERTRIELVATGEKARKRTPQTPLQLTPQEDQVCRLAAEGSTNAEIAARMYVSASTVDYHLRKAFQKLGVRSRAQLAARLSR